MRKGDASQTTETTTTTTTTVTETTAAEPTEQEENNFSDMAVQDYILKPGKTPAKAESSDNGNGTVSITLTDENGEILDIYTVDSETGKGTDSNGDNVDLPQTGNNDLRTAAAVAAAAVLMVTGAFAAGAALRRKEEE